MHFQLHSRIKGCGITAEIKKYKSIIKKKKKTHEKILILKKLINIEVLISRALIDSLLVMMNLF